MLSTQGLLSLPKPCSAPYRRHAPGSAAAAASTAVNWGGGRGACLPFAPYERALRRVVARPTPRAGVRPRRGIPRPSVPFLLPSFLSPSF
ncbi:hypothetical protein BHM03_00024045 [Ensete ventricosum]|nr:hypothetical protein BHM03_00024045 [Ensete ventricosum]